MNSNFKLNPSVNIIGYENSCFSGWDTIILQIEKELLKSNNDIKTIVVDCYQGVHEDVLLSNLTHRLCPSMVFLSTNAFLEDQKIREITHSDVTDDRIFGYMTRLNIADFIDKNKILSINKKANSCRKGILLFFGIGASLLCHKPDILIYADMARWEIQLRMRRNEVNNLGLQNNNDSFESQYKRSYFVDWRVCDRHKKKLTNSIDLYLDTNSEHNPVMITAEAYKSALKQTINQPFSIVPYFDEGPWGGQWMKEKFGLDQSKKNYAWCFNCVPEENSLKFNFGGTLFEIPSINLVFEHPKELLGEAVHARFGDEFPIRFDYLDTMDGGNLSLQVHPLTEYIQEKFGVHYTQDESYYLMEAGPDAKVYLGLNENVEKNSLISSLKNSDDQKYEFEAEKFIKSWPAKKHDHFLIPGGTVHCSGNNCMVLEISATPYIFTFKLWDWNRLGLDGKPRPININHGIQNIQWDRNEKWVSENLVNRISIIAEGKGWLEERTGLHEREFIETRRHWFTEKVHHNTNNGVNVITLIEGDEITVESPNVSFLPFTIHFAETFIVPSAVGSYTIKPSGTSVGKKCATIKAYVRT